MPFFRTESDFCLKLKTCDLLCCLCSSFPPFQMPSIVTSVRWTDLKACKSFKICAQGDSDECRRGQAKTSPCDSSFNGCFAELVIDKNGVRPMRNSDVLVIVWISTWYKSPSLSYALQESDTSLWSRGCCRGQDCRQVIWEEHTVGLYFVI